MCVCVSDGVCVCVSDGVCDGVCVNASPSPSLNTVSVCWCVIFIGYNNIPYCVGSIHVHISVV